MNNYEYGFITKCAEYGVDPNALIKAAGWFSDDNTSQENAVSKALAAKAKVMGLKGYDRTNLPGTAMGRWFSRMFRGEEGYRNALARQGVKELEEQAAKQNSINSFMNDFAAHHFKPQKGQTSVPGAVKPNVVYDMYSFNAPSLAKGNNRVIGFNNNGQLRARQTSGNTLYPQK